MIKITINFSLEEYGKPPISYINRTFDVIVEAVFIFDVILNFRTTFVSKSGNVVFNPNLISKNYLRSWFIIDLFAAIPIDLFTIFLEFPVNSSWENSNIRPGILIHSY